MTRFNLIKAIPFTIVAMLILAPIFKETGNVIWAYVCYAVIVVGAVFIFTNQHRTLLDEKVKKRQLLMLVGALICTVAFFIFQYYQIF